MKNKLLNKKKIAQLFYLFTFLVLVATTANAQFNTGTITIDGTANEAAYITSGNYSVAWDDTYLYIRTTSGTSTEPTVAYFDVNPMVPVANSGTATTANGNPVGYNNTNNVTPTLPFMADFMIYWRDNFAEFRTTGVSGAWSVSPTSFAATEYSNTGGVNREIRIAWSAMPGAARPAAFNWMAFNVGGTGSGSGPYNSTPTLNQGGLAFSGSNVTPLMNYYFSVTSTANNASIVGPFAQTSLESRATMTNSIAATTLWDYTLDAAGATTHTFTPSATITVNNALLISASNTFTMASAGGAKTLQFGTTSTNTPSLTCNGTLTPNNGSGNDLSITAAFGTTTIAGSALNTAYRIFNLTVNANATVQAPSTGTVDLGWQFGTISVASTGVLNFVNGSGVVNLTNSGTTSTVNISNSGTMTFNNLTNNTGNTLRPATSPATSSITINGTLSNTGTFSTSNTGLLDIIMTGTGSTNIAAGTYQNLTIANTGSTSLNALGVTASGSITIASSKVLTINSGARLNMPVTASTLTITGATSSINGFLRIFRFSTIPITGASISTLTINSGGTYENSTASGGSVLTSVGIPIADWKAGSTCAVIGLTSPTAGQWFGAGADQTFSNFTWNCPNQTTIPNMAGATLTATGTFTMASTGTTGALRLNNTQTTGTITCGNFTQTGGTIDFAANVTPALGTLNCSGTFNQTGGTLTETNTGSGKIVLNGANASNQNVTVSGTISNTINWEIGTGSSTNTATLLTNLVLGTSANFLVLTGSSIDFGIFNISGGSAFTLNSGATLISANTDSGVLSPTTNTIAGSVRVGGTKTYNAAANYIFNGAAAQTTGSSFVSAANVTISNSSGVALTGSTNLAITGNLVLTSGAFNLGSNTLTYSGSSITRTSGTITATNASLVFTNASAVSIPASTFQNVSNLTVNGTGGVTMNNGINVTTALALTSGTLTVGSAQLLLAAAATVTKGATGFIDASGVGSIVSFNNTGAIAVPASLFTGSIATLILNGVGGTTTLGSATTVSTALTLTNGTLALGANTLTYAGGTGSIGRTNGTINASATGAILAFTNTAALALPASLFTGNIDRLTINGAGGVTLGSATTVATRLDLTSGALTNGTNLTLGNGATITRNAGNLTAAPTFGTTVNVTYNGGALSTNMFELPNATSFPTVLNDLTISTTGAILLSANLQVNGNLSMTAGGNLNIVGNTLTYAGNSITRGSTGFINVSNASAILNFINSSPVTLPSTGLFNINTDGTNNSIVNLTIAGSGTVTIPFALNVTATLSVASTRTLSVGGILTVSSASDNTVAGIIAGTSGVTKTGAGILTLSGVNTYTGGTIINVGTLSVALSSNLGGTSSAVTLGGGTLNAGAGLNTGKAISLTPGTTSTINVTSGTATLSGIISNSGSLTKTGTGTLLLSGNNSYSGTTTVSAGTINRTLTGISSTAFTPTTQSVTFTTTAPSNGAYQLFNGPVSGTQSFSSNAAAGKVVSFNYTSGAVSVSSTSITATLTNSPQTFTGSPIAAAISTNSGGTQSNVRYNGVATVPTNAGTYAILVDVAANGSYAAGTDVSAGDFVIGTATPTLSITGTPTSFGFTGNAQGPTVSVTNNSGGTQTVLYTSTDGGGYSQNSAPSAAGAYQVTVSVGSTGNYNAAGPSNAVAFTISTTTAWNGSSWSFGTPTALLDATINAAYSTGAGAPQGPFSAKSLTVASSGSLTVATGTSLTVAEALTNNSGTITVQNNANLIQTAGTDTNSGTGSVTVNRDSNNLKRLDYTLWSTPIKTGNRTLASFSPLTTPSRNYVYNAGSNVYNSVGNTGIFSVGTGYLIRMPDVLSSGPGANLTNYYTGSANLTFNGEFTGTALNNGLITVNTTASAFNAIGNPYPSTISANTFLSVNGIASGTLYFWRKTNNLNQATAATTSYAVYTAGGGGVANGGFTPSATIQVGQGFIVQAPGTSLVFNNTMRAGVASTEFMKTKAQAEKSRIWLNLNNGGDMLNQTLIGYMAGATLGVDNGIDGKSFGDGAIELASNIDGASYTIQGRPAFDANDVVSLNFKTSIAGTYSIAIDHVDGLFSRGQDIYLVDKTAGTTTNLNEGTYTFTAAVGVDNTRFTLTYQKTLKVDAPLFNENSVLVSRSNGTINVKSTAIAINNVKVYDIQGRLVAERKNVKSNTATISNVRASQVLIVKVTAENNAIVTKKVLN